MFIIYLRIQALIFSQSSVGSCLIAPLACRQTTTELYRVITETDFELCAEISPLLLHSNALLLTLPGEVLISRLNCHNSLILLFRPCDCNTLANWPSDGLWRTAGHCFYRVVIQGIISLLYFLCISQFTRMLCYSVINF